MRSSKKSVKSISKNKGLNTLSLRHLDLSKIFRIKMKSFDACTICRANYPKKSCKGCELNIPCKNCKKLCFGCEYDSIF